MRKYLTLFIVFLIIFNEKAFSCFVKDSLKVFNKDINNQEINDLFTSRAWNFKEIIETIESLHEVNNSSFLMDFASQVLKQRDFIITDYLSRNEETCPNLGKVKKYLEIKFNMWVVQSKLLPLLKENGLNFSYNEEKNRLEQIK